MTKRAPSQGFSLESQARSLATTVNQILDGRVNSNATVTLTANQATTTVTDFNVGSDSVVLFMPITANAAAAISAGTMYVSAIAPRSNTFTITHANNAQTDRDFKYIVLGSENN